MFIRRRFCFHLRIGLGLKLQTSSYPARPAALSLPLPLSLSSPLLAQYHTCHTCRSPLQFGSLKKLKTSFSFSETPHHYVKIFNINFREKPLNCETSTAFSHLRWNSTSSNSLSSSNHQKPQPQVPEDHHSILKSLRNLENSLRFHGYSTLRIGFAVLAIVGVVVYLLWEPIRENVAVEVSQVASLSLQHEEVMGQAEEFAKSLLHTILHDESMHILAAQFVKQVLNSPETRQASIEYINSILEDPHTRQLLASTIKQVLLLAINDRETTVALKAAVILIMSDPESQRAARQLISAVFKHPELQVVASDFFGDVMKSQVVKTQATELGKEVTYNVITDPHLKEETGKSFWQAVKYSVTPGWLSGSSSKPAASESSLPSLELEPQQSVTAAPDESSSPSPSASQPAPSQPAPSQPAPSHESSSPPSPSSSSSEEAVTSSPSPPSSTPPSSSLSRPPQPDTEGPHIVDTTTIGHPQEVPEEIVDEDTNILT